jgi:hypothetical protein
MITERARTDARPPGARRADRLDPGLGAAQPRPTDSADAIKTRATTLSVRN